jgi:serine/threonine protein kinase
MPAPATADELLDLVRRSGVADEAKLKSHLQSLSAKSGLPQDPQKLAGVLVRDGLLTYFQAEQLLQGKYKRFTIGKYKVLEKLGAGGMAQVFLCEHKLMRRRVAIKVLPAAKADDASSRERFYREARAVAAVDHPNIVRAYDIDQDENLHFLVMEYVDGTNLQDLVKKFGPLDVARACHYVYAAAVGLQHAHEMGLVHRDVKPGNILLDRAGVIKVLDLGLARFFHDEDDVLTKKYDENVLGTADYLAPEQARESHTVDIRADIYALGATFYYLLTGSTLYPEGSVAQKLLWHQTRPPRPIRSLRPEVPEDVAAVADRMMAKDPADRYQTPAEVMAALADRVAAPIPPPPEREMPLVSPAAAGRGPATMPAAGGGAVSSGFNRVVTAPAPVSGYPAGAAPTPPADVWETLDTPEEARPATRAETARSAARAESSVVRRPAPAADRPRSRTAWYAAAGVLALAGVAAAGYFAFLRPKQDPPPAGPQRVVVGEGEGAVPTLREALGRVRPGDTIAVAKARLVEPGLRLDRARHQNLTIEGATADGRPVVEFSGQGGPGSAMLDAGSVDGFRLRNVELDGAGKADVGVQVSGACPGLALEGVTVGRVKSAGVKLLNAAGDSTRPVLLDRVRVVLGGPIQTGVLLTADAKVDTARVLVRNGRFEGAGKGVRVDGPATDLEVSGNRFFGVDEAVAFTRVPSGKYVRGEVTGNTVYGARAGVTFDLRAPPGAAQPAGRFELTVARNYFGGPAGSTGPFPVGRLTGGKEPIAGVLSADNARGPGWEAGTAGIKSEVLDEPQLPEPNPDNDATFLRFPGGPPAVGPNKARVGAP